MKIWVDDVRPAPDGYQWCKSVNDAKEIIMFCENPNFFPSYCPSKTISYEPIQIELIDIDHDAGEYANDGGDFINLLNWLEQTSRNYPIRIHSMNPVGRENMRRIIQRNGWIEVK